MSKIAKKPVLIKEGITAIIADNAVQVTGPKGVMSFPIPQSIQVAIDDGKIVVNRKDEHDESSKAFAGLTRAMIANMATGVAEGFKKKLEMIGVGYRAQVSGNELTLHVGFSHPVKIKAEEGIQFAFAENMIIVSGMDKALVGNAAAKIRAIRPPEPYKGKGIKYQGEYIRRKAGKAAKAVGGK